jgi:integrase
MARKATTLSDIHVRKAEHTGAKTTASGNPRSVYLAVGGVAGLYLQIQPTNQKSWILRTKVGEKRKEIGLGTYGSDEKEVNLKQARAEATKQKEAIRAGIDPIAKKKADKAKRAEEQTQHITFKRYSKRFVIKQAKEHKGAKQSQRLNQLLRDYIFPHIGETYVKDIKRNQVVAIIEPIWETKNETAKRVQNYVQRIIQLAIAEGVRTDANPATWNNDLELSFPKARKIAKVESHPFIEWRELPKFMKVLDAYDSPTDSKPIAKCFAFMVLTVARPSAARLAEWDEIDLGKKVWTIPADKPMRKVTDDWKIPLTEEAIKLLKSLPSYATQAGNLFTLLNGGEIPYNYPSKLPKILGFDAVAHGFRSTFRTWGQDHQAHSEEVLEACMTHKIGNAVRSAYARSDLLEPRRKALNEYNLWAMRGKQNYKVTSIRRRRAS